MLKDRPKTTKEAERPVITMEQAQEILRVVKDEIYYPAFLLLLTTGARRNEVLGLQWEDIDLAQGRVSITKQIHFEPGGSWHFGPPKSDAGSRKVPLPEGIVQALINWKNKVNPSEKDFVCATREGSPLRPELLNRRWLQLRKDLNLPDGMHLHDLRHSFITWHAENGSNPKAVAQIVGHSDERTTIRIYQAVTSKMVDEMAQVVEALVPPDASADSDLGH